MGLYSFQLVDLIIEGREKRPDFDEMFAHHICAVALTGGMLMTNNRGVGIVTAYIHIWADIPVQISRILSTTYYAKTTAVSLVVLISVWIWTRVFILGKITWIVWFQVVYPTELSHFNVFARIFAIFATSLYSLHVYWTVLLFKMMIGFIKSGANTDL
jgi:hypothetical protein